ncbi:probable jasmonic acid carboxyl methyltransferase 2 [Magnolia sinica]|uniref:probable jasmonic acid carboxyl methyltransferase 2 n=1 Tax=Magnolia sinica TaxID=86752 RepID=UPI002659AB1F|nr:probable jasmonic acid carboxyl methyltransferase 2 [Magnolia sinica]
MEVHQVFLMNGGSGETEAMQVQPKVMEVPHVLHMNGGCGETSYAKNSVVQNKIISIAKPIIEEAILDLYCNTLPKSLAIADLGCSSGPNTLLVISEIIDTIHEKCCLLNRPSPEFQVFLNDLPANDFNSVFRSLPAFQDKLRQEKGAHFGPCFISGVPGSFYGRLFPDQSLQFVHSSSSLHWLSQVPPELDISTITPLNKQKIFISKTSPPSVIKAYFEQFQRDFSLFLKSRSEEIVPGGRMVLAFVGRRTADPTSEESCHQWELLAHALNDMVLEGIVEEEKVDSFNAPYYSPSPDELKSEIEKQGSFALDQLEVFEVDWDATNGDDGVSEYVQSGISKLTSGQRVSKTIRAVVESMIGHHFGEEIMDDLFQRYSKIVDQYMSENVCKYANLVISVVRKA